MRCPLEIPTCKRKLMTSNDIFEKKQCPLNAKLECALSPPTCPLLPQTESKCGYAKLLGEDVNVNQCPCKTCFLAEGCPISLKPCPNISTNDNDKKAVAKWPANIPPCLLCTDKSSYIERIPSVENAEKKLLDKPASKTKNSPLKIISKCSLISSPRPIPCSECILQEFSGDNKGGREIKSCPYLRIPNVCGKNCYCPDVPSVEVGPLCPFAPQPCPCCATPRCPLTRQPDCILQPKPPCCLQSSKCPSSIPCCCGLCGICFPGPTPCSPTPRCFPCSAGTDDNSCPCPPPVKPCNPCLSSSCPVTLLCSCSQPSCPLSSSPCCPSPLPCIDICCSSPSCLECLLKKLQCFLDPCSCPIKSICPPIPSPCSLKSDLNDSNNVPKQTVERTFHIPTCPSYVSPCGAHMSLKEQCPFSPNPCPIGFECPFPVSMKLGDKQPGSREEIIMEESMKKNSQVSRNSSKIVKFDLRLMGEKEIEDSGSEKVEENGTNQESVCPYSPKCGVVPLPTCPAAAILCPDSYIKPPKIEKKPCPFKKCMKKQGCPLGKLKPEVDCKFTGCPLTKEPDCPLGELVNRCQFIPKCSCSPPGCCSLPLACPLNEPCERDPTDGHSLSFLTSCSTDITKSRSCSSSCFTSLSISKYDFLESSSCRSNLQCSVSNALLASPVSLSKEKLVLDGCCGKDKYRKLSQDLSRDTLNSDCPLEHLAPKRICRFAPPKCPLTPKPTTCPLTRKLEPCALSLGSKLACPVEYPSCKKFPSGRCPMGDLNICDCEYPVSPCILPLQESGVIAPPQYCFREDCCMGLPYPPSILKTADGEIEKGPFYQFKDTKPGQEETKHFVKISKEPFDVRISLFGNPRERVHNNWTIVKHGEGHRRCKTVAKKLESMGPIRNFNSQYDPLDCPIDEETQVILENRKKHERDIREIENLRLTYGIKQ